MSASPGDAPGARGPMEVVGPTAALVLALYLMTASGHLYLADAWATLATAESLVLRGTPAIEHEPGFPGSTGPDGRFYCQFGLGAVLDLVPAAIAGRALAAIAGPGPMERFWRGLPASLVNAVAGALTAALLALVILRIGMSERTAVGVALAHALATFAWPQAKADASDPQVAAYVTAALWLALPDPTGRRRWGCAGVALGLALLVKLTAAPFWVAFAMYAWPYVRGDLAALRRLAAGPAAALAALAAYNTWRFGSPLSTGYSLEVQTVWIPVWMGVYGLTLSIGKGLVFFAPPAILSLAGARAMLARRPDVARLALWATALDLAFLGVWQNWDADWSYGPRYVLPLLPFLMVLAAPCFDDPGGRAWRPVRALLVGAGVGVALLGVLVDHTSYVRWLSDQKAVLGDFLARPDKVYVPLHPHHFNPDLSPLRGHAYLLYGTVTMALGRPVAPMPVYSSIEEESTARGHRIMPIVTVAYDARYGGLDVWPALVIGSTGPAGGLAGTALLAVLALAAARARRVLATRLRASAPPEGGAPGYQD